MTTAATAAAVSNDPSVEALPDELSTGELLTRIQETLDALRGRSAQSSPRQTVHIRNFRSATYRLREELVVSLHRDEEHWIATSYDTGQYGYGVSSEDAIEHLLIVLEGYYEILQEERENLSRQLQGHLRYLDSVLAKVA